MAAGKTCCSPHRVAGQRAAAQVSTTPSAQTTTPKPAASKTTLITPLPTATATATPTTAMMPVSSTRVEIPGGKFQIGTNKPQIQGDGEEPLRRTKQDGFLIAKATVTNQEFSAFVDATGYVTEAERFGWSFVFYSDLPESVQSTQGVVGTEWWRIANGANWQDIHGPGTKALAWKPEHPVVQVSWNDAKAYADWVGGRLPTEAEWEHAARGGKRNVRFPWGNEEPDDEKFHPCNIWQGKFPNQNTIADGWATTAPAISYEPNGYGLYNLVGNVWEWTADPFQTKFLSNRYRSSASDTPDLKLLKGGSFLCHRSYCYRYRIAARIGNSADSTTTHQGFRIVWD